MNEEEDNTILFGEVPKEDQCANCAAQKRPNSAFCSETCKIEYRYDNERD